MIFKELQKHLLINLSSNFAFTVEQMVIFDLLYMTTICNSVV
jgi:hypothetical protein